MKLTFVRHGETDDNVLRLYQGHKDTRLNSNGLKQAKLLAERLRDEDFDAIYSSDLSRAMETAREIRVYHPTLPFYPVVDLRERYLSNFEGKKMDSVDWKKAPKDLETWEMAFFRGKIFLDMAMEKHKYERILCVSHGGIGRAIVAAIKMIKPENIPLIERLENASFSIYEINSNGSPNMEILYNCTEHLKQG